MFKSPKIFFVEPPGPRRELLLNCAVLQRAKELGFNIDLNENQDKLTEEQWTDKLVDVDALITTWGAPRLTKAVLSKNTTLKIVGHAAGSVAPIISPELYERGIKVVSSNFVMARSVAEWSLMMTIFSLRKIADFTLFNGHGSFNWGKRKSGKGMHEAVIGIWGFGDVAKHLINFLKPFSPGQILVNSNDLMPEHETDYGVQRVSFHELFMKSDVIHLLASLNENTFGRVGAKELGLIRNDATLINVGRAALVEPNALLYELGKKRFKAVLDVHYEEPLPPNSLFHRFDNVILSPHSAGCGTEGLYIAYILDEFKRFFSGNPLKYEVSQERASTMSAT